MKVNKFISKKNILFISLLVLTLLALHINIVSHYAKFSFYLVFFLFSAFVSLLEIKKKNNIFYFITFVIAAMLVLINLFRSLSLQGSILLPYNQIFTLGEYDKLLSITESLKSASFILLFFCVLMPKIDNKIHIYILLSVILTIVYFEIIYSLATQSATYLEMILKPFATNNRVCGFNMHSNMFGYILLCGIISTVILYEISFKKSILLIAIPMLIVIFFTFSKTNIIIAVFLLITYFGYKIFNYVTFCSKKMLWIIASICSLCILALVILACLENNIVHTLVIKIFNFATLSSRALIWKNVILMLNYCGAVTWIFGFSFVVFNNCLNITYIHDPQFSDSPTINQAHNGLLESLGIGGLVFLMLDLILLVYILYKIFTVNKKSRNYLFMATLLVFCILFEHFFESFSFLTYNDSNGTLPCYTILIILMSPVCFAKSSIEGQSIHLVVKSRAN